jgi:hypothetical protein
VVYDGRPSEERWGDTFAVKGSGNNTIIIAGSRGTGATEIGQSVAIFTTADNGESFSATEVTFADAAKGSFGLGLAFGQGTTIWGKGSGTPLVQVEYAIDNGIILPTGGVISTTPVAQTPNVLAIGIDTAAACLVGVASENPDNLKFFDIADPLLPVLVDQELFGSNNVNANGTGGVALGGGRVYALNTNNGLMCCTLTRAAPGAPELTGLAYDTALRSFRFQLEGVVGRRYLIQSSVDLTSWQDGQTITLKAGSQTVEIPRQEPQYFFRAKAL